MSVHPLYTPYRHGSHAWAFDTALGRVDSFDSREQAERIAAIQKRQDEAECRDASKTGILTGAMRMVLKIYPADAEQPSETASVC